MTTRPETDAAALAEFNRFYDEIHVPEVLASNPGFVRATRFELASRDSRLDSGPRWLAVYELQDETAAHAYLGRDAAGSGSTPTYTPGPPAWVQAQRVWRVMWRRLAASGSADSLPHAVYMVGMDAPEATDQASLAEFNAFYTGVHVPEVVAAGGYARGTRYELYRDLGQPHTVCPRFCAIYEADASTTSSLLARGTNPATPSTPSTRIPLSSGPPSWEAHQTRWRLVYRRIGTLQPGEGAIR